MRKTAADCISAGTAANGNDAADYSSTCFRSTSLAKAPRSIVSYVGTRRWTPEVWLVMSIDMRHSGKQCKGRVR
ncbi:hypothetical protein DPMN_137363 [Dreissena polymorpha]|uniref:Uncharacterized protein n=1 Tax=Dreissena polymorpha TaxID=45954 RepID=A0A9D4JDK3_DREPO|nr:hypothetical protein DPMN_137363 [Dreissena polymorpha]